MNSTSVYRPASEKYDEAWRRKPINHISHLSFNSLQFAMCLREENTKKIALSDTNDNLSSEIDIPKATCPKSACQSCQEDIFIQSEKKIALLKKLDGISREFDQLTLALASLEEKERETNLEHTLLEHELSKLRVLNEECNLSEKLSLVRNDGLELKRQIDLRAIELRRLKSKQQNYLPPPKMTDSKSLPLLKTAEPYLCATSFNHSRPSKLERRVHTGVYKRSAGTNWELAWSCCLNPSKSVCGCSAQSSSTKVIREQLTNTSSGIPVTTRRRPVSANLKYM